MASYISLKPDKHGNPRFRLQESQGRGNTAITRSWTGNKDWSKRKLETELRHALKDFENDVREGRCMTRAQARERAAQVSETNPLLNDLFQKWMSTRTELAAASVRNYNQCWRLHIGPAVGGLHLQEVKRVQVADFLDGLRGKGLSVNSVKICKNVLHGLYEYAIERGMVEVNPADRVKVRADSKDTSTDDSEKALSVEELSSFMDSLEQESVKWRAYFGVLLDTGARRGEVYGLQWSDIDWTAGTITISRSWDPSKAIVSATKNGRARTVPVSSDSLQLLQALRREQAENGISLWCFPGKGLDKPGRGEPGKVMDRIADRAGLRHIHPHTLRHSVATLSLAGGADVQAVADLLGHASVKTTISTYIHGTGDGPQRAAAAAAGMVRSYRSANGKTANQA